MSLHEAGVDVETSKARYFALLADVLPRMVEAGTINRERAEWMWNRATDLAEAGMFEAFATEKRP